MADIVLVSFNARYEHTSLGVRCLLANLGELKEKAILREFTLDTSPETAIEDVLKEKPKIISIGVYIWNVDLCIKFAKELKALRPQIKLICGGPEISYETETQTIYEFADFIIRGEGEIKFRELCVALLKNYEGMACSEIAPVPFSKIIKAEPVDLSLVQMPYELYSSDDINNRLVYIEASRGCPFGCEFCLSSLDKTVRYFPLEKLLDNLSILLKRGLKAFKFTDRSFNLDFARAEKILNFFLKNYSDGLFLHFEIVPDKLTDGLLNLLAKFPKGTVQLEAGIQSFNYEVSSRIHRIQNNDKIEDNIKRILTETGCYIHADLVAGLPGEDLQSFALGFNRLYKTGVHEIQVGILKLLHGASIARHNQAFGMKFSPNAPYEIRENNNIAFEDMRRLKRFSRYWDLISNSGVFVKTSRLICSLPQYFNSPFAAFMALSDFIYSETHQTHCISRTKLRGLLFTWLTKHGMAEKEISALLEEDALTSARQEKHHKRQARKAT